MDRLGIYENGNGDELFTCDGGLTFVPNASNPTQNVLDTAIPAHQNILNDYNPVLVARQNPPITVYVDYLEYYDTRNNNIYYSSDGGKTFVRDQSNPSTRVLDPSNPYQKAIIDNLAPRYVGTSYIYKYERYLHLDTGKEYYSRDGGKTFVDNTATPADIVLDGGVPADAADIARLEKQYETTPAQYAYEVYEDRANNNQLWYTGDGAKVFSATCRILRGRL